MRNPGGSPAPDDEVLTLIRSRHLEYPIASKAAFLRLMTQSTEPVFFRGKAYDAGYASFVPDFFFPVASEQDLVTKITELLISRGLLPLRGRP
jgi:hypothetical protein